mgnify:CR=1 FL=1
MTDINNGIIKAVASLAMKKHRDDMGLFVAEGTKCVRDTWDHFRCKWLIATRTWYEQMGTSSHYDKIVLANKQQMSRMSQFSTPSDVIAVYEIPRTEFNPDEVRDRLSLVLDNIQDPGNLGTILRLADWFGITDVFASKGTVDVYNHKVVQATMGAISRVKVHYGDLEDVFDLFPDLPIYGTFLNGENIYQADLGRNGFIVMGNEGQGIGAKVAARVTRRLTIPAAERQGEHSESLNVGIAAAITISEFARRL